MTATNQKLTPRQLEMLGAMILGNTPWRRWPTKANRFRPYVSRMGGASHRMLESLRAIGLVEENRHFVTVDGCALLWRHVDEVPAELRDDFRIKLADAQSNARHRRREAREAEQREQAEAAERWNRMKAERQARREAIPDKLAAILRQHGLAIVPIEEGGEVADMRLVAVWTSICEAEAKL